MTVSAILAEKGRSIVSVSIDRSLTQVCDVLAKRRIGAVVVLDAAGGLAGILSERDVVRALASDGPTALDRPVTTYMTRAVQTCAPQDAVSQVMERMTAGRFRHLPVLEGGVLVAVISIGDVVKHRIAQAERDAADMRTYIHTA